MPDLPEIGAKATLDMSEWDASMSRLLSDASKLDKLLQDVATVKITLNVEDSGLRAVKSQLEGMDAGVQSEIKFVPENEQVVTGLLTGYDSGVTSEIDFKKENDQVISDLLTTYDAGVTSEIDFSSENGEALLTLVGKLDQPITSDVYFKALGEQQIQSDLDKWDAGVTSEVDIQGEGDYSTIQDTLNTFDQGVVAEVDIQGQGDYQTIADTLESFDQGVTAEVDIEGTGDYKTIADTLESFDQGVTAEVDIQGTGDYETIRGDLDTFDQGVTAEVDFQGTGDYEAIRRNLDSFDQGVTAEVKFDVTGDNIEKIKNDIASTETVKVKGDTSDLEQSISDIKTKLDEIHQLAVIDLILNVPEAFDGLINTLTNLPGVGGLIEMDNALANIQGRTGEMIPGAEELIIDLYTNAWGDSINAIGDVIVAAHNLGIANEDLEQAVGAAFNLEALGIGDASENLRTLDSMVKNNLAPDFDSAADIIALGLQTGANRGQDLLDTFNEYGSTFQIMKISGPAALNLIASGIEAGVDNSDRVADAMREIGIRLREIGTDPNIASAFDTIDKLAEGVDLQGALDMYNAGKMSGDDFFAAFFQSIREAIAADPTAGKMAAIQLVGTISEDFGPEVIAQLDPQWDDGMGSLEGRAQTAADNINNTLKTAITELQRVIETDFMDALDKAFNITGLVDTAKEKIKELAALMREGKGFGEALEVVLEVPGLNDMIQRLESVLGNIGIAIMQGLAGVIDFVGGDSGPMRRALKDMATAQFGFDLKLADDGQGITDAVNTAISRGVDTADITDAVNKSVDELLTTGEVGKAQQLLNDVVAQVQQMSPDARTLIDQFGSITAALEAAKDVQGRTFSAQIPGIETWTKFQDAVKELQGMQAFESIFDLQKLQARIEPFAEALSDQLNTALMDQDWDMARAIGEQLNIGDIVESEITKAKDKVASKTMVDMFTANMTPEDLNMQTVGLNAAKDFWAAFNSGDLTAANQIFEAFSGIGDYDWSDEADALKQGLAKAFMGAISSGDKNAMMDIGRMLGVDEETLTGLYETVDLKVSDIQLKITDTGIEITRVSQGMSKDLSESQQSIQTDATKIGEAFGGIAASVLTNLPAARSEIAGFASALFDIANTAASANYNLGNLKGTVGATAAPEGGGGSGASGAASGGERGPGAFMVGEAGRELVTTNVALDVLNSMSTRAIMSGIQAALAGGYGGGGNVSNSSTYSPTVVINTNSRAQDFNTLAQVSQGVRGFS